MIQTLDLFGKNVMFYFNGKTHSKTRIGGLFSLCFFGFIIWSAYHVSQDMFLHRNPRTVSSESFSENPAEMIIKPDTFTFAFGVQHPDTYAHYIDDSVYTAQVTHRQIKRTLNSDGSVELTWKHTPLVLERCKLSHFGELGPKFADIELDQLFCFTLEQQEAEVLRVQGVYESPIFEHIAVSLKECNETATTCAPAAERKKLLEGGWFAVYYTNLAVDTRNYDDPTIRYRDSMYTSFGNNYFKESIMWLSHVEVISDLGWLVNQPEVRNFIKVESTRETFNLRSGLSEFFSFVVRVGKITTHHDRSYIKVQDILAEVNGLAGIGIVAAIIIVAPYSNLKFYESLINELFDVNTLKKESKNKKKLKKKEEKTDRNPSHFASLPKQRSTMKSSDEDSVSPQKRRSTMKSSDEDSHEIISSKAKEEGQSENAQRKASLMVSFSNNLEALSIDLNEGKDNSASTKVCSPEQSKNLFLSPTHTAYLRRIVTDHSLKSPKSSMIVKSPTEDKRRNQAQLSSIKTNKDTMEVILDTFVPEKQGRFQSEGDVLSPKSPERPLIYIDLSDNEQKQNEREEVKKKPEDKDPPTFLTTMTDGEPKLNLTFWEYLRSYVYRSPKLKEKLSLLREGQRRINERLDIFNVFKKLRELDKLKLLLLENEQLVLFDGLPKPELTLNSFQRVSRERSQSQILLKEPKFINENNKKALLLASYESLKAKPRNTIIDQKLLHIFEETFER